MPKTINSINNIKFNHGGRFDTGYWTTGKLSVFTNDSTEEIKLTPDQAEGLEYTILEFLRKNMKLKVDL